jgi:hypothetical protein
VYLVKEATEKHPAATKIYQVFFGPQRAGVCENADIYASLLLKGKVE